MYQRPIKDSTRRLSIRDAPANAPKREQLLPDDAQVTGLALVKLGCSDIGRPLGR